jgi:prepilin-type N-terminal cleavage/methylation domain-containing protein
MIPVPSAHRRSCSCPCGRGLALIELPVGRMGFTLIELLVVVTIIVVLLALLTPALDRAITNAEMAACGATIKSLVSAGTIYAMDHARSYPSRGESAWDSLTVKLVDDNGGVTVFDVPAQMRAYIGLDSFLDPLGGGVDLSAGSQRTGAKNGAPTLYSNYQVYFDWGRPTSHQVRSAKKVGQAMVFTPPDDARVRKFNILVADLDSRRARPDGVWDADVYSGHADKDGKLEQLIVEDKDNPFIKDTPLPIGKVTTSWWWGFSPPHPIDAIRGLADYNYGWADNSVSRLNDVEIDDERCAKLPLTNLQEYNADRKAQLPMGH